VEAEFEQGFLKDPTPRREGQAMRPTRLTKWILALLFLASVCQLLAPVPVAPYSAIVFWGLSLAFLVTALVLAVRRRRGARHVSDARYPGAHE
jgi:protein-S-isoprenylcysteine O-methyltransferase Ste14